MAIPSFTMGQAIISLSAWREEYEPIANAPGSYDKHAIADLKVNMGASVQFYKVDIPEAQFDAAPDKVALVQCVLRKVLQQAFADMEDRWLDPKIR